MIYDEKNSDLKKLAETSTYTLDIDWDSVEKNTGVKLHENVKNFFSRITGADIKFLAQIYFEQFTQTPENSQEYQNWLDVYSGGIFETELSPLYSLNNIADEIKYRFEIGGNSNRIYIGQFFLDIGQISILINNDNGNIEWCDFGYGYFEVYEDNPFGIMFTDIQDFLDMLVSNEKTEKEVIEHNKNSDTTLQ